MARLQQKKQAAVTTGTPQQPAFPAQWFDSVYVLSLVYRAFSHHRLRIITADLIPASGDQDHTILPYAPATLVSRANTPIASRSQRP
jgi:hypothetical protein